MSAAKNQRLLYVLLPAVLVVWGLIFQRIWAAVEEAPDAAARPVPPLRAPATGPARRLPTLLLTYVDPFRPASTADLVPITGAGGPGNGRAAGGYSGPPPRLNLPVAPPPVAVAPVQWPALKYLGSITNARRNTCVALLTVENGEAMVKAGDSYRDVKVTKIFRDSVQVLFQGQRKTVQKSI